MLPLQMMPSLAPPPSIFIDILAPRSGPPPKRLIETPAVVSNSAATFNRNGGFRRFSSRVDFLKRKLKRAFDDFDVVRIRPDFFKPNKHVTNIVRNGEIQPRQTCCHTTLESIATSGRNDSTAFLNTLFRVFSNSKRKIKSALGATYRFVKSTMRRVSEFFAIRNIKFHNAKPRPSESARKRVKQKIFAAMFNRIGTTLRASPRARPPPHLPQRLTEMEKCTSQ